MINSEPEGAAGDGSGEEAVDAIVRGGAKGAAALAGIATAIVIGLWFAFYLLIFVPRGVVP